MEAPSLARTGHAVNNAIYSTLGDRQHALEWLDRAFAAHAWFLVQIEVEPLFASLHGDAHFEELVRRVRNER